MKGLRFEGILIKVKTRKGIVYGMRVLPDVNL